MKMKMRTLKRCVLPVCEFRCTRWPSHLLLKSFVAPPLAQRNIISFAGCSWILRISEYLMVSNVTNVMSQIALWMAVEPKTPPRKKGTHVDGSKGESAKRVLCPTDRHHNPFDTRESEWLKGTLGAVASTLSDLFDKRVSAVEQRISAVEQQASNTQCTTDVALDNAQRAVRDAREVKDIASEQFRSLEKQLAVLSATTKNTSDEIAKIKASRASSCSSGSRPSAVAGATAKVSVPYRERTKARIGNLGWDTEADALLARDRRHWRRHMSILIATVSLLQ